jgi:dipicolinate synthase subunit A
VTPSHSPARPLAGLPVAVVGGDQREIEIVRLMLAEGLEVRAIGLPPGAAGVLGRRQAGSVAEAVNGAGAIVCPIPGLGVDDSIYAPQWPKKLYVTPQDLAVCARPGAVVMGTASPSFKAMVGTAGLALHEYETDDELMILRSRAIAEGAVRIAIERTDVTLHRTKIYLLGFGRVSVTLCEVLLGLGADLTVVARNPAQLARAWEMGAEPLHIQDLPESISEARVIFNTIPVRVLDEPLLARTAQDALIIDLSAPPGGVDHERASALGRNAVWARGLGSRAPVSVGQSQWKGIRRILLTEFNPA